MADGRARIGWLHVSDLHVTKQKVGHHHLRRPGGELWAEVLREFLDDLDAQLEATGLRPELVLITGDLVYSGEPAQYEDLDREFLGPLLRHLRSRGVDPVVFGVPGNHDVRRPSAKQARNYRLLREYDRPDDEDPDLHGLREELWQARDAGFLTPLFPGYLEWMERTMLPTLSSRALSSGLSVEGLHRSHVPGDLSVIVARDGLRLLLVGLNSAWIQFDGGDFQGKLHVPIEQLYAALASDVHEARQRFDHVHGALLLMHHPPNWLSKAARRSFDVQVYPSRDDRFSACLFGHMHEARSEMVAGNGAAMRYFYQSPSLFGLEHYGQSQARLDVGYSLGALYEDEEIRLWVRRLTKHGRFSVDPELVLRPDGALQLRPGRAHPRSTRSAASPTEPPTRMDLAAAGLDPVRPSDAAMLRSWLLTRYDRLELLAPMSTFSVPFDEVYIPLSLSMQPAWQGRRRHRRGLEPGGTGRELELPELFARAQGDREVIVLGEPGSGKSTTLEKICHQLLVEGGEAVGLPPQTLPLLLPLRHLTAADLEQDDPLRALARREAVRSEPRLPVEVIERLWSCGGLLLLLDGLDEVADEPLRDELFARLVTLAARWRRHGVRMVLSSRFSGLTSRALEGLDRSFLRLDVRPMERTRLEALVQRWFRAAKHWQAAPRTADERARADADAGEHAARVIVELRRIETFDFEFKALVASPLLLTLVCAVALANGQIPHERPELYQRCLEVLLRRSTHKTGEPAPLPEAEALRVLQVVAFRMHEQRRRDGLTAARLQQWALHDREQRRGPGGEGLDAAALLRWLHEHAGVLTAHGEDDYGFAHLTYQEYLAALHVAYEGGEAIRELAERFGDPWWQEVTLLSLAQRHRRTFETFMDHVLAGDRWLGDEVRDEGDSPELRRGARPPMELLRQCWEQASERSVAPFLPVLERPRASGWWRRMLGLFGRTMDTGELHRRRARVLQLLLGQTEPELLDRARRLRDDESEDGDVRALARELVDRAERRRPVHERPNVAAEVTGTASVIPKAEPEAPHSEEESLADEALVALDDLELVVERPEGLTAELAYDGDYDEDDGGFAEDDGIAEASPVEREAVPKDIDGDDDDQSGFAVTAKRLGRAIGSARRSAHPGAARQERRRSEPTRGPAKPSMTSDEPTPTPAPQRSPMPSTLAAPAPVPEPELVAEPAPEPEPLPDMAPPPPRPKPRPRPPVQPPAKSASSLGEEAKPVIVTRDIPRAEAEPSGMPMMGAPLPGSFDAPPPSPAAASTARPPATKPCAPEPEPKPEPEPEPWIEPTTGIRFLWVPGGTFAMGSTDDDPEADQEEQPSHVATVTGFWLAETPVTNAQYQAMLLADADAPEPAYWRASGYSGRNHPVVGVRWSDAQRFCSWLSRITQRRIALPSEAQWERAARGDDARRHPWGNEPPSELRACFGRGPIPGRTNPVGDVPLGRGPYGHLDLVGNVWEWCQDTWDPRAYARASLWSKVDPVVVSEGADDHTGRGGGWSDDASRMRSACRVGIADEVWDVDVGFRVCVLDRARGE
ncbi:SUMF1/EgtB/PvdO family nonheme iron enzyme [Paraliomyxa miuraensis]|uniref:SUMF1/EgtB/PvdO family nonheme iron enzyme n=1 Tax=Paraliomyxa miuraensis TaxID=376150 RepID=UPI00224EA4BC|nr:SUMF1/EgtB/PvdO family nonheme iron enzyme [Paraliomyxa miuraensis]MCX4241677.1 SUMF1/EgtB/PvdO family nonheme iron enzyme [Paraliomyxa miuraensis]